MPAACGERPVNHANFLIRLARQRWIEDANRAFETVNLFCADHQTKSQSIVAVRQTAHIQRNIPQFAASQGQSGRRLRYHAGSACYRPLKNRFNWRLRCIEDACAASDMFPRQPDNLLRSCVEEM